MMGEGGRPVCGVALCGPYQTRRPQRMKGTPCRNHTLLGDHTDETIAPKDVNDFEGNGDVPCGTAPMGRTRPLNPRDGVGQSAQEATAGYPSMGSAQVSLQGQSYLRTRAGCRTTTMSSETPFDGHTVFRPVDASGNSIGCPLFNRYEPPYIHGTGGVMIWA